MLAVALAASTLALVACSSNANPGLPSNDEGNMSNEPTESTVTLYLPDWLADANGFNAEQATTDGTAENIIVLLEAKEALPKGSALISFTIDGNSGLVEMNSAFESGVGSKGTIGEYLMLGSLVNTLLGYYELDEIWITVGGAPLETGHNMYDYGLGFFEGL